VPVALIGILMIRGFVYPHSWGKRSPAAALLAFIGAALTLPLASYSDVGLVVVLATAAIALFPYRKLAVRYLKARTRSGLESLADLWGTQLQVDRDSGRWDVVRDAGGPRAWVGNVLTYQGSVDPGVKRSEVGYMLAFVFELSREPPFQCSLMMGWEAPRYFEREWRATHVIRGEFLSLSFGELGLEADRGRSTGGLARQLRPYDLSAMPSRKLHAIGLCQEEFDRLFTPDVLEEFVALASQTYPYELNVTPTSVNIYSTYCDRDVQRSNLKFLERLVQRLGSER
jgi:hypothetical protein